MTGHRVYGPDLMGDWTYVNSTSVQLATSLLTIGGLQYDTANLQIMITVNGVGGLDVTPVSNNDKYYVYAVIDSGNVALIASLSKIGPAGYTDFNRISTFYTNNSGGIVTFIDNKVTESEWQNAGPVVLTTSGGGAAPTKPTTVDIDNFWWKRQNGEILVRCEFATSNNVGSAIGGDGNYLINMPNLLIDVSKMTVKSTIDGRGGVQFHYNSVGSAQLNFNTDDSSSSQADGIVFVHSATELSISAIFDRSTVDSAHGEWGSSSAGTVTGWYEIHVATHGMSMTCNFSVPILGWDK